MTPLNRAEVGTQFEGTAAASSRDYARGVNPPPRERPATREGSAADVEIALGASMATLRSMIHTGQALDDEVLLHLISAWKHTGQALELVRTKLSQLRLPGV